ncbi:MAG TPA: 2-phospho-L-lactate transferase CofD family protein [Patescibacteria group bacterium]
MDINLKVCTIGGGSGMPIINKALVQAGFRNISSIVTIFDSGGDSGRMRTDERGRVLAFSDYWRALISLWEDGEQKEVWEEMLRYRDGRGRNFGNTFFQFMSEKSGNLTNVEDLFSELTKAEICGKVIPVSLSPADVCFKTMTGKIYCGEHYMDEMRMSLDKINEVWLKPQVDANIEALKAVKEAELIIFCPGSMYGSILTNLLPNGMIESYRQSKAKKILMTNIMSAANENDCFSQNEYVETFGNFLGLPDPVDVVLMPDMDKLDKKLISTVLMAYKLEHSAPIRYDKSSNHKTIVADIATIDTTNMRLRHSVHKLKEFFLNFGRN